MRIIILIYLSIFLYLGVCICTEWFSEKPEFLENIVLRHLQSLSGSSTFITSTFSSAASSIQNFFHTYTPPCINYILFCTDIIAGKAKTYYDADMHNFDYKLFFYQVYLVLYTALFILFVFCFFVIYCFVFLFIFLCVSSCLVFSYAVLISIYCYLFLCLGLLFFLKMIGIFILLCK